MPVHSLHIFDRKGKTLFTKCFVKQDTENTDPDLQAEQRKLVFGMLFSLREVAASLSPDSAKDEKGGGLQLIRTGAATLHTYETASGLRLALFVTGDPTGIYAAAIRKALQYVYHDLWIQCVIRSPLYRPTSPNVEETNFASKLQGYLANQPWYKG